MTNSSLVRERQSFEDTVRLLEGGKPADTAAASAAATTKDGLTASYLNAENAFLKNRAAQLAFCFIGLQVSYLTWAMMQELIMTTKFLPTPRVPSGKFPSAGFCVFSNRFLAVMVSAMVCYYYHGKINTAVPLTSFAPCAISNTLSSWSQYQALTYVSFSLQTIFKSIKILPVMLMGRFVKGSKYSLLDYFEATLIACGVLLFSTSKSNWTNEKNSSGKHFHLEGFFGFLLLVAYVMADSFTSQWQSRLYRDYNKSIDHFQMMYGVNLTSIMITLVALIVSGEIPILIEFFTYNPGALYYNVVTSTTSVTGQFVVFYTIKHFGPELFTIMMTTRQMLSIAISNYVFGHQMSAVGYISSTMVFGVVLFSSYRQIKSKKGNGQTDKNAKLPQQISSKSDEENS